MTLNNTETNVDPYDQNGAVIYTIVILLFYSLSLFCSLILNIDPDDYHYDKTWLIDQRQKVIPTNRVDILDALSNPSIRQKYWRIYYGDEEYERRSNEILPEELKRLSLVSQRMKELNSRQTGSIEQSNRILQPSPDPSLTSFLSKFRRGRSTSFPFVSSNSHHIQRPVAFLAETPLCKPSSYLLKKK